MLLQVIRAFQPLQEALATLRNVPPCRFEVARVPWVGNIARPVGEIEQHANLAIGVASADDFHVPDVPRVHAYKQVETLVVVPGHLPCCLAQARYAVLRKLPAGRGIHVVPNLFGRCGSRLDVERFLSSCFADKIFHHELSHRTAANVAVTHEKYAYHIIYIMTLSAKIRKSSQSIAYSS